MTTGVARHYPNRAICGAGVAFKLAWGVGQVMTGGAKVSDEFRAYLLEATALAALGTIADVVPLVDENRILAAFGPRRLEGEQTRRHPGADRIGGTHRADARQLSRRLPARARGSMPAAGWATRARRSRCSLRADHARAVEIATYLEQQNRSRQTLEKSIVDAAVAQVEEQKLDGDDCRAIVLGGDGWHPGVIGIVASRIVDKYCKPRSWSRSTRTTGTA
jgi:single-stranded-DNA-specific exonuclease